MPELANAIYVSKQSASRRLNGHIPFSHLEIDAIAVWLSVPREVLEPDPVSAAVTTS